MRRTEVARETCGACRTTCQATPTCSAPCPPGPAGPSRRCSSSSTAPTASTAGAASTPAITSSSSPIAPASATAPAAAAAADPAGDLVDEDLAEQRAHAALTARADHAAARDQLPRLERLIARLERRVGADTRWSLHRVAPGDWSVITIDGDSGHGDSAAAALSDLLRSIDG
jgi:hypothetical protein